MWIIILWCIVALYFLCDLVSKTDSLSANAAQIWPACPILACFNGYSWAFARDSPKSTKYMVTTPQVLAENKKRSGKATKRTMRERKSGRVWEKQKCGCEAGCGRSPGCTEAVGAHQCWSLWSRTLTPSLPVQCVSVSLSTLHCHCLSQPALLMDRL